MSKDFSKTTNELNIQVIQIVLGRPYNQMTCLRKIVATLEALDDLDHDRKSATQRFTINNDSERAIFEKRTLTIRQTRVSKNLMVKIIITFRLVTKRKGLVP